MTNDQIDDIIYKVCQPQHKMTSDWLASHREFARAIIAEHVTELTQNADMPTPVEPKADNDSAYAYADGFNKCLSQCNRAMAAKNAELVKNNTRLTIFAPNGDKIVCYGTEIDMATLDVVIKKGALKFKELEALEPVAKVIEYGATVQLAWDSVIAAHKAKVGTLVSLEQCHQLFAQKDAKIERSSVQMRVYQENIEALNAEIKKLKENSNFDHSEYKRLRDKLKAERDVIIGANKSVLKQLAQITADRDDLQRKLYRATNPPFEGKVDTWQAACGIARREYEELKLENEANKGLLIHLTLERDEIAAERDRLKIKIDSIQSEIASLRVIILRLDSQSED